jgi:hypothetical protein
MQLKTPSPRPIPNSLLIASSLIFHSDYVCFVLAYQFHASEPPVIRAGP